MAAQNPPKPISGSYGWYSWYSWTLLPFLNLFFVILQMGNGNLASWCVFIRVWVPKNGGIYYNI